MAATRFFLAFMFVTTCLLLHDARPAAAQAIPRFSSPSGHKITFSGPASGGTLVFMQTPERNTQRLASITTSPGETAESVAGRLAAAISETRAFGWPPGGIQAQGPSLGLFPGAADGSFILTGTETGLGIPPPPNSLSCRYDAGQDLIVLRWVNPSGNYDRIAILKDGFGITVPGDSTEYLYYRGRTPKPASYENVAICVVGYRNGIPSSAAAIHLRNTIQEESIGLPFHKGTAPNWRAWGIQAPEAGIRLEERRRPPTMHGKTFYQMAKPPGAGSTGGACRRFIGLVPGHIYRVSLWVNTAEMERTQADWSFSVHAAPGHGADLSTEQLRGAAALPGGANGPTAGQIARYRGGVSTGRYFARVSTAADESGPERTIDDITLPPSTDSITVWVRFACDDVNAPGVAFDHLRLEDLTAAQR